MNLLIGTYVDDHPARMAELLLCLRKNIENSRITAIHAFVEDTKERFKSASLDHLTLLANPKVVLVGSYHRLTYAERLDYANQLLARAPNTPVALANSDIFFDDSIALLTPKYLKGKFVCLSRRNLHQDGTATFDKYPAWAQDAWIFSRPVKIPPKLNFGSGRSGCDNRFAAEMRATGLKVVNPALSVKIYHVHESKVTHYGPKVGGAHLRLAPTAITATER